MWFNFILGSNFISLCFEIIIIHYYTPKQAEREFKPRIKLNHNISIPVVKSIMSAVWMQKAKGIYWIDITVDWTNDPLFLCKYYSKILVWTRNMWIAEPCEDWGGGGSRRNETTCITRGERIKNWTCKCNQRNLAGWRNFEHTILTGIGLGITGYCCAGWWNYFGSVAKVA